MQDDAKLMTGIDKCYTFSFNTFGLNTFGLNTLSHIQNTSQIFCMLSTESQRKKYNLYSFDKFIIIYYIYSIICP